jgi:hypothetical protein
MRIPEKILVNYNKIIGGIIVDLKHKSHTLILFYK